MRLTASRAQMNGPTTLVASTREIRAASICVDAHLHLEDAGVVDERRPARPSAASHVSNSRMTSASTETSAATATRLRAGGFDFLDHRSAASRFCAILTQTA